MKKKILCGLCAISIIGLLTGCQAATRSLGGDMTIKLEPGEKLELITWKDDDSSLWYLTRPMREDEKPETHVYKQFTQFHMMEGTVTIVETK